MAALTNGDFESRNLNSWDTAGDVSIQESSYGSGPTQGSYQALLRSGDIKSEMWQIFDAKKGEILSFDWNFLTNEGTPQWQGHNDRAYVELYLADGFGAPHILADTWSVFAPSASEFSEETGFKTFFAEIPSTDTYMIKFGVETTSALYHSALLIDNITIKGESDCMPELANGNFEAGNLLCWKTKGDVSIQQASYGSGPTQGNYQALLKSGDTKSDMSQSFMANEGDILSFDWNFLTNEGTPQWQGHNDKAYVKLHWQDAPGNRHILADTWSDFNASATEFDKETGYKTFSVEIPGTDACIIKLGVQTTGDALYPSALLVDNVKLQKP